jgi:hypothetical protein
VSIQLQNDPIIEFLRPPFIQEEYELIIVLPLELSMQTHPDPIITFKLHPHIVDRRDDRIVVDPPDPKYGPCTQHITDSPEFIIVESILSLVQEQRDPTITELEEYKEQELFELIKLADIESQILAPLELIIVDVVINGVVIELIEDPDELNIATDSPLVIQDKLELIIKDCWAQHILVL